MKAPTKSLKFGTGDGIADRAAPPAEAAHQATGSLVAGDELQALEEGRGEGARRATSTTEGGNFMLMLDVRDADWHAHV